MALWALTAFSSGKPLRFARTSWGVWGSIFAVRVTPTPHRSLADVVEKKVSAGAFNGKIVLIGATATGIGDLRTTPYGGLDFPGVEIHANVIDNILHQSFLVRGAKQTLTDVLIILFFGFP
jgi:CHASE2 domain-containing sensor protein